MTETNITESTVASGPSLHVLPLQEFLDTYLPAYYADSEWEEIPALLSALHSEKTTIDTLRAVLQAGNDYEEPIYVDEETKRVGNGMHRICAAILEQKETLTFTYIPSSVPTPIYEIDFRLISQRTSQPLPRTFEDDDEHDDAINWIRSFPLGSTWVTSDTFAGSSGIWTGYWYCPPELVGELQVEIQNRVRQHTMFAAVIVSVKECKDFD